MAIIKAKYYRLNNAKTAWDEINFKTTADLVVGLKDAVVNLDGTQTITGSKTFTKATLMESTSIPLTVRRKNNSAGIYAGLIMERGLVSGTGPKPYGIGGYFKAANSSGTMTHTGLFGGRLVTDAIGEVVFAPAYDGGDPYLRTDFRLRARSSTLADIYLTGDIYTGTTPNSTGTTGNKLATETWVESKIPIVPEWAKTPAPGFVRYMKMNADNTISWLSAADMRTDIGAVNTTQLNNAVSSHNSSTLAHQDIRNALNDKLEAETDPIFTAWDKSTGISITKSQVSDLIEATQSVAGLLSAEDKTHLDVLVALLENSDGNNVVDTIGEVLAIFNNYPEGADLVTALAGKVDKIGSQTIKGTTTLEYPTAFGSGEQAVLIAKVPTSTTTTGSISIVKEGPNSGIGLKFEQKVGTTRLLFRGSSTQGAMVWAQPEEGSRLYLDVSSIHFRGQGHSGLGFYLENNAFLPAANNTKSIGTTSRRFSEVHATTIYEAGTPLASKYSASGHTHNYDDLNGIPRQFTGSIFVNQTILKKAVYSTINFGISDEIEYNAGSAGIYYIRVLLDKNTSNPITNKETIKNYLEEVINSRFIPEFGDEVYLYEATTSLLYKIQLQNVPALGGEVLAFFKLGTMAEVFNINYASLTGKPTNLIRQSSWNSTTKELVIEVI